MAGGQARLIRSSAEGRGVRRTGPVSVPGPDVDSLDPGSSRMGTSIKELIFADTSVYLACSKDALFSEAMSPAENRAAHREKKDQTDDMTLWFSAATWYPSPSKTKDSTGWGR
jgi:hypothetical protein